MIERSSGNDSASGSTMYRRRGRGWKHMLWNSWSTTSFRSFFLY